MTLPSIIAPKIGSHALRYALSESILYLTDYFTAIADTVSHLQINCGFTNNIKLWKAGEGFLSIAILCLKLQSDSRGLLLLALSQLDNMMCSWSAFPVEINDSTVGH